MINGSAKILFYNENAESIVASAGRISTTKGSADEIYIKSCARNKDENIKLIQKIISSGHMSVLEHIFLNLSFDNVSVFVEQFMIEFRLASFTVKSRRYVDFGNMGFVLPAFEKYGEKADAMENVYRQHMKYLFEEYRNFLDLGIPKEDARFVLPYSFRSNFYCTVNLREFIRIVKEMIWGRGQEYEEISELGKSLLQQCKDKLPFIEILEGPIENKDYGSDLFDSSNIISNIGCEQPEQSKVTLLDFVDNPEEKICRAALLSRGIKHFHEDELRKPVVQKKIIKNILLNSRKRELEQVNYTILFNHISLSGITHLVRHRMQAIIVPKYNEVYNFNEFIIPKSIDEKNLTERYKSIFARTQNVIDELVADGMFKCDLVYLLLSGLTVPVMTTMNANELFTFISLRTCSRAQWEIADNAKELLKILRAKHPVLFSFYGPTCYSTGICTEGRMTCGKMGEVQKSFADNKF